MKAAFIGPIQSGKSSLVSAISGKEPPAPGTAKLEERAVPIPDPRLDWLTQLYNPQKTVSATLNCIDVPGFNLSDSSGRSATKRLIDQTRTVDMFIIVVRAFKNDTVPPYRGSVNPNRDINELLSELILIDLELVTTRIENLEKQIKKGAKNKAQDEAELGIQKKLQATLENEEPLRTLTLQPEEAKIIKSLNFFTLKPITIVINSDEDSMDSLVRPTGISKDIPVISLSARLEQELSQLDIESRKEFMEDLGMRSSAAEKLISSCYAAMGLISFLTVGPDEVRAWPIRKDSTAFETAGKIHSDIQRGFIRAETMSFDDLSKLGNEKEVKAAGKMRLEGKEYIVQDGDIINFRFNI